MRAAWLLAHLGREGPPPDTRPATEEDIYYCYRLFLHREPDPAGLAGWVRRLAEGPFPLRDLVHTFMASEECRRSNPRVVQLDGYKLCVRPSDGTVSTAVLAFGEYEPNVIAELAPLLKPGGVFVDIGANIGYLTMLAAARVGPAGRVLAFEPNPDNVVLLREGIRANGFTNIELFPLGAADRQRTIEMYPDGQNSTSLVTDPAADDPSGVWQPYLSKTLGRRHVLKTAALDDVLGHLDRVDIVKLDIDGGEPRALDGMDRLVRRHRPVIFVEYAPVCIQLVSRVAPETVLDYFYARDYDLYNLDRATGKSPRPLAKDEVLAAFARCGITHLDLVAYPREAR